MQNINDSIVGEINNSLDNIIICKMDIKMQMTINNLMCNIYLKSLTLFVSIENLFVR